MNETRLIDVAKPRLIYKPTGKGAEYSNLGLNLYYGCPMGCRYCYVPGLIKDKNYHNGCKARIDIEKLKCIIKQLEEKTMIDLHTDRVLMCFISDPFPDLEMTINNTFPMIKLFKSYGIPITVLSKNLHLAKRYIRWYAPFTDEIATTITTIDKEKASYLEPNAQPPDERINDLIEFSKAGLKTWISFEPLLYPDDVIQVIMQTKDYIDEYRIGTLSYVDDRELMNIATSIDYHGSINKILEVSNDYNKTVKIKQSIKDIIDAD